MKNEVFVTALCPPERREGTQKKSLLKNNRYFTVFSMTKI